MHHTTYSLHGFTIKISQDDYDDSPDNWGDDELFLGEINNRNMRVGRKGWGASFALNHIPFGEGPWDFDNTNHYDLAVQCDDRAELRAAWEEAHDRTWLVYPVRVLSRYAEPRLEECDHDECEGYIFQKLPYASDLERLSMPGFDAEKNKDSLISTWNTYLSGDVHHVSVLDSDNEVIEGCGGIYGLEDAKEHAAEIVSGLMNMSKKVPMVIVFGTLPLPFPGRVEAEVTEVNVPLHIGLEDAVRWVLEEGPLRNNVDVISVSLFLPHQRSTQVAK